MQLARYSPTGWLALILLTLGLFPAPVSAQRRGDCQGAVATGWQSSMVPEGEPGEPMLVTGRVIDADGNPLAEINIYAYQTDDEGYYSRGGQDENNARICAVIRTNERGEYALETIRPGSYPTRGVPAHIHFELWRDGAARERQDLQFADDEFVSERRKVEMARTSTVRPLSLDGDGIWRVERDFRMP